jgi:hypothetical protein
MNREHSGAPGWVAPFLSLWFAFARSWLAIGDGATYLLTKDG